MVPDSETEPRSNTGCWSILLLDYAIAELYGEAPAGLYPLFLYSAMLLLFFSVARLYIYIMLQQQYAVFGLYIVAVL